MLDASPDGDSFSALWKFLAKAASQVKTSLYNHQVVFLLLNLLGWSQEQLVSRRG